MGAVAFWLIWPILFLAGLVVRRRNSRKTYSARLDSWALKYDLTRLDNEVMGRVEDIGLSARLSTEKGGDRSEHYLTVYTRFEPPLDLGLSIRSRHDLPFGNAGRFAVYTGDTAFDRSFYVYADEPGRATHLLTPALRHLLRRAHAGDGELLVTDQGIASQRFARVSDDQWLEHCVHTLLQATRVAYARRDRIPAAAPLRKYVPAWARFAQQNDLSILKAPLGLWGRVNGAQVYAYAVRTAEQRYELELWLQFEQPLGLGLLVQPMQNVDRFKDFFAAVDHKLGEPNFDETFLVRVSDASGVDELLDEPLRACLLRIHHEAGPLSLTDEGISLRVPYVPPHPGSVPQTIDILIAAAVSIHKARFGSTGGPYR